MNTEWTIFKEDTDVDMEKINLVELEDDERNLMRIYVETTRHIQEINQLFHIYKCNLDIILFFYRLNGNDIIERNPIIKLKESNSMMINALTTNLISSGKTLADSIQTFLKTKIKQYKPLEKKILKDIYDNCFYYRFMYNLRNFSQHGHLPVQVDEDKKCYFDLDQILRTPYITHNTKVKKEMEQFKNEIYIKFEDYPRIAFSLSIAEYNLCIIEIYMKFLENIENIMLDLDTSIKSIIKKYPEIIHKSKDSLNGFVLYDIEDDNLQCFDSRESFIDFFLEIKKEISELFIDEEKELQEFRKGFKEIKNGENV